MSLQHHRSEQDRLEAQGRFMRQFVGADNREYPDGRMGADDDGGSAFVLIVDDRHRVIKMVFPVPMEWVGFSVESAEQFRDALTERIQYLKGVRT